MNLPNYHRGIITNVGTGKPMSLLEFANEQWVKANQKEN